MKNRSKSFISIDPLEGLNESQREAVQCTDGPVLVLAGAGSGKTRVLTHRIAYIISKGLVRPWQILAVTFTNKAAGEIKERVAQIAEKGDEVAAGTFHSMMLRVLRREAEVIGYRRDFTIFDSSDTRRLVKQILDEFNIKNFRPPYIHGVLSRLKNDLITPEEYAKTANFPLEKTVAQVYPEYQRLLKKYQAMDFDDLITLPLSLFRNYPAILNYWSNRWQYLLVDEFQDTNRAQFELVKMLAGPRANLFAVGDDDQSIYSWRGARVENIFTFRETYPNCHVFHLEQNYRSTQPILNLAHEVVKLSSKREPKKLWTEKTEGKLPVIIGSYNDVGEIAEIVNRIEGAVSQEGRGYNDFAILYRTNAQSRLFEDELRVRRIPYQIIGSLKFYDRREVKDVLAYWRICLNPNDDLSLRRILKEPPRGIGDTTLERVIGWTREKEISILEGFQRAKEIPSLPKRSATFCVKFGNEVAHWTELLESSLTPVEWGKQVIEESGYLERLRSERSFEAESRLENIEELLSSLDEFVRSQEQGIREFLETITLVADIDNMVDDDESVRLMTVHAAKGLEFPVVFVCGMEQGLFPLDRMDSSDNDADEERRLFYVAVTRAEEELYLTHARFRMRFGQTIPSAMSNFLSDIPEDAAEWEGISNENLPGYSNSFYTPAASTARKPKLAKILKLAPDLKKEEDPISFHRGDLVEHPYFGKGIVLGITSYRGDHKVTVDFDGEKKLLLQKYAQLKPVKD